MTKEKSYNTFSKITCSDTLSPPLAASSRFMVLSLEISRSGRLDVHNFRTQQAECFLVRWLVTTTNSTSSPTWEGDRSIYHFQSLAKCSPAESRHPPPRSCGRKASFPHPAHRRGTQTGLSQPQHASAASACLTSHSGQNSLPGSPALLSRLHLVSPYF